MYSGLGNYGNFSSQFQNQPVRYDEFSIDRMSQRSQDRIVSFGGPFSSPYLNSWSHSEVAHQNLTALKKNQEDPTTDKLSNEAQNMIRKQMQQNVEQIQFNKNSKELYSRAFHGTKDDTVQLNINFKTLLVQYFRQLIYLNQMTEEQIIHVEKFAQRVPSFKSLSLFYHDNNQIDTTKIRTLCLEFLQSSECIKRILTGRCRMKSKIMMIKFIQKVRVNLFTTTPLRWKQNAAIKKSTLCLNNQHISKS